MKDNFKKAKKILTSNISTSLNVIAVNGCCYGKDNTPDKGDYLKLCGQRFWEFISGNSSLYINIIEPLGHKAKEMNEAFMQEYNNINNMFTLEFLKMFCNKKGNILWEKIVEFNSSSRNSIRVSF